MYGLCIDVLSEITKTGHAVPVIIEPAWLFHAGDKLYKFLTVPDESN